MKLMLSIRKHKWHQVIKASVISFTSNKRTKWQRIPWTDRAMIMRVREASTRSTLLCQSRSVLKLKVSQQTVKMVAQLNLPALRTIESTWCSKRIRLSLQGCQNCKWWNLRYATIACMKMIVQLPMTHALSKGWADMHSSMNRHLWKISRLWRSRAIIFCLSSSISWRKTHFRHNTMGWVSHLLSMP